MLSYRHGFHAGNHADVLKHFIQVQLHEYMNQKDTAYTYIDTHSGAGVYALDSDYATKNAEFKTGIAPLWERDDMPPAVAQYVDVVRAMNPSGRLRYYPGSPYIAEQLAREQDRLRLFELHPSDSKILAENFRKLEAHHAAQGQRARGKRVIIERGDGFHGLKALLPPPSRRALVLIDPPYEIKDDYRQVKEALDDALGRFPSGMYAIWYPVLQRMESRQFADKLKRLPAKEWLHVTLTVSTPTPDGVGLHTSGMFLLNPPYTLEPILRETMPWLVQAIGTDSAATFTIEKGTQVTGALSPREAVGRQPVGNARRASPLSGGGSLRLPGQRFGMQREEGERGARSAEGAPARAGQQARPQAGTARGEGGAARAGQQARGQAGAARGEGGAARAGQQARGAAGAARGEGGEPRTRAQASGPGAPAARGKRGPGERDGFQRRDDSGKERAGSARGTTGSARGADSTRSGERREFSGEKRPARPGPGRGSNRRG
jgi:23S rRNA A2030 N6-methylase RlmJ